MSMRKYTAALFQNIQRDESRSREDGFASSTDAGPWTSLFSGGQSCLQWPRVLLFGDSLTQYAFGTEGCWGALMADKLQRRADVINRGFSGYNTRWAKIVLEQVFREERPIHLACVVILLGSNDASCPERLSQTHVPLSEYEANLTKILSQLHTRHEVSKDKIVLVSPPPVNRKLLEAGYASAVEAQEPDALPAAHHNDVTRLYAEACCRVGAEAGVETLDLFSAMSSTESWPFFFSDGIHFSRAGAEYFFERLWPLVEKRFVGAPFKYPYWRDVDSEAPDSTLNNAVNVFDPHFKLD